MSSKEYNKEYYKKHRENILSKCKEYYRNNSESIKTKRIEYVKNNPDKIKSLGRRYYENHKEQCIERSRQWRIDNKTRASETKRIYHESHMEEHRVNWHIRKARKTNAHGSLSVSDMHTLSSILGDACLCCGWPVSQIDHIVPLARGGTNHPTNIQPLCRRCNSSKGARNRTDYRTKKQIKQVMEAFQLKLF